MERKESEVKLVGGRSVTVTPEGNIVDEPRIWTQWVNGTVSTAVDQVKKLCNPNYYTALYNGWRRPQQGSEPVVVYWTGESNTPSEPLKSSGFVQYPNGTALSETMLANVRQSLAEIGRVANIRFVETNTVSSDVLTIRMGSGLPGGLAGQATWAGSTQGVLRFSDIAFNPAFESLYGILDTYLARSLRHEGLHVLGLQHPCNNGNDPLSNIDETIMSYRNGTQTITNGSLSPLQWQRVSYTPQIADIRTLQTLYGANATLPQQHFVVNGTLSRAETLVGNEQLASDILTVTYEGNVPAQIDLRSDTSAISAIGNQRIWVLNSVANVNTGPQVTTLTLNNLNNTINPGGDLTVKNFDIAYDKFDLSRLLPGVNSLAELNMSATNNGTSIPLGSGKTLLIEGVLPNELTAANFVGFTTPAVTTASPTTATPTYGTTGPSTTAATTYGTTGPSTNATTAYGTTAIEPATTDAVISEASTFSSPLKSVISSVIAVSRKAADLGKKTYEEWTKSDAKSKSDDAKDKSAKDTTTYTAPVNPTVAMHDSFSNGLTQGLVSSVAQGTVTSIGKATGHETAAEWANDAIQVGTGLWIGGPVGGAIAAASVAAKHMLPENSWVRTVATHAPVLANVTSSPVKTVCQLGGSMLGKVVGDNITSAVSKVASGKFADKFAKPQATTHTQRAESGPSTSPVMDM